MLNNSRSHAVPKTTVTRPPFLVLREITHVTCDLMNWSEQTFISYLKAVDDTLEAFYGTASDQDEFEQIKQAHEQSIPPETMALRLRAKR